MELWSPFPGRERSEPYVRNCRSIQRLRLAARRDARATVLSAMATSIAHRGPDAAGEWHDAHGRALLAHRRLSIIDLSDAANQPMLSADARWVITFNGEIYNFEDIRAELRGLGINCRGRSDTEVLVEALAQWGPEAIAKEDGMFAFAAFNQETGELFMARDPFGEKPLYYAELKAEGIAFASELQALEHVPGCDLEVSIDSVSELLAFQYIGAPRTIYRSIRKLAPGHWLRASAGKPPEIVRLL